MKRYGKVGVQLGDSSGGGISRLEVIKGPIGRRRRTKAERARIAVERLVHGASVADVARRHEATRLQRFNDSLMMKQVRCARSRNNTVHQEFPS